MRINNSGSYEFCRWKTHSNNTRVNLKNNIQDTVPLDFFQHTMAPSRTQMLAGNEISECLNCSTMEQHGKISGRQRQLLKTGVMMQYFKKSLLSSPYHNDFEYSKQNQGITTRTPSDWQIDLGNYCNGACIFCNSESSSRLATEFKKIGLISEMPPPNWCDDKVLLDRFIKDLTSSSNLKYLHFLGGETVITPAFKTILQALIDSGQNKQITIGFTTNLTVWSTTIVDLLKQFDQVNLGLSIETLTPINDYVRYPGKLEQTKLYLDKWVSIARDQNWLTQLRITPTCLTIHDITTVFEYVWNNQLSVESCNFLHKPEFMRISVLPPEQRTRAISALQQWINNHPVKHSDVIVNTRNSTFAQQQIIQDAQSYIDYLQNSADESFRLSALVNYLHKLEDSRGNSILDYIPEYEQLFKSHGY
jgi:organic radical activating enzyme